MLPLLLSIILPLSAPQIILDRPTIRGSMPRDMVRSSIKRRLTSISSCYQNAPSPIPKNITVRLVVGADGRVKSVRFTPSKNHQVLKTCLKKELLLLIFPKTCGGITMIDQPIRLRPPPKKKPPKYTPKPKPLTS